MYVRNAKEEVKMGEFFGAIILIALVIVVVIIGINFTRGANMNYRVGKGMFEHSDNNLEDEKEISDKEYYDGDGGLFK